MTRHTGSRISSSYEEAEDIVPNTSRLIVVVSCLAAVGAMVYGLWWPRLPAGVAPEATLPPVSSTVPSSNPLLSTTPPADPSPSVTPPATPLADESPPAAVPHIGIVVGHWGNDVGAICDDGLTEVEINLDIAQRVVHVLQALGYQADLLEEFDPRLTGYQADALVSIHADSCKAYPNATPPASGFKVASVEDSLVPEEEEQLVTCLAQCYAARTGMYFHSNSITFDMTRYHTFYEVNSHTPAAIIEAGFMFADRQILTQRADLVAQGIADGIVCFIEGEMP